LFDVSDVLPVSILATLPSVENPFILQPGTSSDADLQVVGYVPGISTLQNVRRPPIKRGQMVSRLGADVEPSGSDEEQLVESKQPTPGTFSYRKSGIVEFVANYFIDNELWRCNIGSTSSGHRGKKLGATAHH